MTFLKTSLGHFFSFFYNLKKTMAFKSIMLKDRKNSFLKRQIKNLKSFMSLSFHLSQGLPAFVLRFLFASQLVLLTY